MTDSAALSGKERFCAVWRDGLAAVVSQLGAASVLAATDSLASASGLSGEELNAKVVVRFKCGGALAGELLCLAEKPVALRLAQLLTSEAANPAVEFADMHRDAFAEFIRQVAGQAAAIWKQATGKEVELAFQSEPPSPETAWPQGATLQVSAEGLSEVALTLLGTENLTASLAEFAAQPPAGVGEVVAPGSSSTDGLSPNLELLLDVELEATIRFGERELLLRDIFALMPGSVVELEQVLNEPAELLIAGRTIARGEVVVVDGHFGLRISEVASRSQRAEVITA
jgi:flagellar motor switch protein FliN